MRLMISPENFLPAQIVASAEGFVWAVRQVPPERLFLMPPGPMGEWSVVRHIFHLRYYEQSLALPGVEQWWGGARPRVADADEEAAWQTALEAREDRAARNDRAAWEDPAPAAPAPSNGSAIPGDPRRVEDLLAQFMALRQKQAGLLRQAPKEAWDQLFETVWGQTSLTWVVSKTYQHTAEHTSDVLKIVLFWDRFSV